MQSNVTVPASGSKFKLWLLIVVLAVAIFGGVAYGYYSWYKTNEPPPSLEMKDGTGLQGMMQIKEEGNYKGHVKFETADVPTACPAAEKSVGVEKGFNYLYSTSLVTLKDFYNAVAVSENLDAMFLFYSFSPGEEVNGSKYLTPTKDETGFYFFPVSDGNLIDYKGTYFSLAQGEKQYLPPYRTLVLHSDKKMKICGDKIKVSGYDSGFSPDGSELFMGSTYSLPKGWVLVPYTWNEKALGTVSSKLKDSVASVWFQAGSEKAVKFKDDTTGEITTKIKETGKSHSVWMNMKWVTDVAKLMKEKKDEGGDVAKDTTAPSIFTVTYSEDKDSGRIDVIFSENFKSYSLGSICKAKDALSIECPEGAVNLVNSEGIKVDTGGANVTINLKEKLEKSFYVISFDNLTDAAGNVAGHIVKTFEVVPGVVTCAVPGDVDGDGKLDCVKDKAALLGMITDGALTTVCADINGNGSVEIADLQGFVSLCPPTPGSEIAACKSNSDCADGFECSDKVPGGSGYVCVPVADGSCVKNSDCEAGSCLYSSSDAKSGSCTTDSCKFCSDSSKGCYSVPFVGGENAIVCLGKSEDPCAKYPAPDGYVCSVETKGEPNVVQWASSDFITDGSVADNEGPCLENKDCVTATASCQNVEGKVYKVCDVPVVDEFADKFESCESTPCEFWLECANTVGGKQCLVPFGSDCEAVNECVPGTSCIFDDRGGACGVAVSVLSASYEYAQVEVSFNIPINSEQDPANFMIKSVDGAFSFAVGIAAKSSIDEKVLILSTIADLPQGSYVVEVDKVKTDTGFLVDISENNVASFEKPSP